jgi:hypothetical protein
MEEDLERFSTACGRGPIGARVLDLIQDLICGGRQLTQSVYNIAEDRSSLFQVAHFWVPKIRHSGESVQNLQLHS